ncbi:MAG: M1 family metallopeptidase [Saprospiraceae bacterium]|nr:M1 family metallopeptidase [Saprospiraceae bacterium]
MNLYRRYLTIVLIFSWIIGVSQDKSGYFQQKLSYDIEIHLDDQKHELAGNISIRYQNNSPDVLDKIGFHLWPNAYSKKNTAFARQKLLHRSLKFYEAEPEQMGGLDSLSFTVDNFPARLEWVKGNPDMAWLILPKALKPGQTIEIKTPFTLDIPNSFSRLGQADQTYQLTQWYPKPAVYDRKGWHLMPYLDQGEFYSEFADYSVKINVPSSYLVAATGSLQNLEEKSYLLQRSEDSKIAIESGKDLVFPDGSDQNRKTLHYLAKDVHDFAWFADRKFYVQLDTLHLSDHKVVECWTFFNDRELWKNSVSFVKRAVQFYSDYVGEYPYPQATAVESALSAGAGMEYPMITVIGSAGSESSLDEVITHEVGHNWFYGVIANNERDHPFMDESINSYYENRYMDQYYPVRMEFSGIPFSRWFGRVDAEQLGYLLMARNYLDQHPDQNSEEILSINYGLDVYSRAPKQIAQAERLLGTDKFDQIMQTYFQRWKFKHPYPEDLYEIFKELSPLKMDWLFEKLIHKDQKIDYAIQDIKLKENLVQLKIKNKTAVNTPLHLSKMHRDEIVFDTLVDGFAGCNIITLKKDSTDQFRIDAREETYELYRHNNSIRTTGWFKKTEPFKFKILPALDDPYRNEIGITPVFGYNAYDGGMIGLFFSQPWLPPRSWRFNLIPLYSIRTHSLVGYSQFYLKRFFTESQIHHYQIGWDAKTYHFDQSNLHKPLKLRYYQLSPYLEFAFRTNLSKLLESKLRYSFHWIHDADATQMIGDTTFYIGPVRKSYIHELKYYFQDPHILRPRSFELLAQFQSYRILGRQASYLRVDAAFNQKWMIQKNRYFEMRLASSFFPHNTERESRSFASRDENILTRGSAGASFQNYHDYSNQEPFIGRSHYDGIWSQQIAWRQGGMKIANGIAQRNNLGNTNSFLAAINLSSDLPVKRIGKYIRPYFDMAYVHSYDASDPSWLASGGINLRLIDRFVNLYFPVWHSKAIRELYQSDHNNNYWRQITFSLRFKINGISDLAQFITIN